MGVADPDSGSAGRRCDSGCESWPDDPAYGYCPLCGENTTRYGNLDPISDSEATSILAHNYFEEFYEAWCASAGYEAEGRISPDARLDS